MHGLITVACFSLSLLIALTIHEFSHALTATLLGDDTASKQGRLSLYPVKHLDPIGTLMIILFGFGWAKPTPVNPSRLRIGSRPGLALVGLAGPLSNMILAMLASLPLKSSLLIENYTWFTLFSGPSSKTVEYFIGSFIFINILLAAFNLIPIAPLDGFKIMLGLLPAKMSSQVARLEFYGPAILILLLISGIIIPGPNILFRIMEPILYLLRILVLGGHTTI